MANFDSFASKIYPLPKFRLDVMAYTWAEAMKRKGDLNQKIRNRDVYRPTLVIGLFWVASLGGGWGCKGKGG